MVRISKSGDVTYKIGQIKKVKLNGQEVQKLNISAKGPAGTEKGTSWFRIKETEGDLAELRFVRFSHLKFGPPEDVNAFCIEGDIAFLQKIKLQSPWSHKEIELVNTRWEGRDFPPPAFSFEEPLYEEGLFALGTNSPNQMFDMVVVLGLVKTNPADREVLHYGIPLRFPVLRHEGRLDDFTYIVYEPKRRSNYFKSFFPAPPQDFPTLPDKIDLSFGFGAASLEYWEEEAVYATTSFIAGSLGVFPSLPFQDLIEMEDA